ncbi:MAG TPA: PilZ domain-containing protein [Candidatus Sulfotelmatobacter sp.]|nr:PilZ domain-containing protein [Candidatus Sulfotelmatobacter sp.]
MNLKPVHHHPKPHRTHLISTSNRSQLSRRRSSRMLLNASVSVSGEDRKKSAFKANAKAVNLNRHGAAVQLRQDLSVGSVVVIRNQRGIELPARVVSVLSATQEGSSYGMEFVDKDEKATNFWGISFPSNA